MISDPSNPKYANQIFKEDLRMAFEEIKAGLAKYTADVEAKLVKNPERKPGS